MTAPGACSRPRSARAAATATIPFTCTPRSGSTTAERGDRRSRALRSRGALLVAVTDHAAERFRQRVRGTLDAKTEIASRVAEGRAAGRVESGDRGTVLVRDPQRRDLVYVCR